MKVLAFDTSSKALAIAILEDDKLLAEMTINIKKNHSVTLMPAIDFLMESLDLKPSDLGRVVVAEGPGSYTGLRIAVATAKTLAHTLKIDLVGVSSLRIMVAEDIDGLVIPLMDARRNNVYAGFYENGRATQPEAHLSFEEVLEKAKSASQVTFVEKWKILRSRFNPLCHQLLSKQPCQALCSLLKSAYNYQPVLFMISYRITSSEWKQKRIGSKIIKKRTILTSSAYD